MTNEPIIICNVILRAWFVPHRHYLEQTKTFVLGFVFVFVLAHEQAIIKNNFRADFKDSNTADTFDLSLKLGLFTKKLVVVSKIFSSKVLLSLVRNVT